MIHATKCDCFDCKNGYTKPEDKAFDIHRKYKKPTGKRPNRTIKIAKLFSIQEKKEYAERMNFMRDISR
jgi:hypothetical protein